MIIMLNEGLYLLKGVFQKCFKLNLPPPPQKNKQKKQDFGRTFSGISSSTSINEVGMLPKYWIISVSYLVNWVITSINLFRTSYV